MEPSSQDQWIQRRTSMSENIISFARFLRLKGFSTGPSEETDALLALTLLHNYDQEQFKDTLQSIFVKNRKEHLKFEKLFLQYWKELEKGSDSKIKESEEATLKQKGSTLKSIKDWLYGNKESDLKETVASYSNIESLRQKNFSEFNDEDVLEIQRFLSQLKRRLSNKKRRRFTASNKQIKLDLRRSIRKNVRYGTDLLELQYKRREKEKISLLLVCDVSKSMDMYSQFLVQFMFAFQASYKSIETFVFSTSLTRISPLLKDQEFSEAMRSLSGTINHWSGGTRIGKSLFELISRYPNLINQHSIVIILSDGWDTGDLDQMEYAMKWIKRKSRKILWLNPLAGQSYFKPETGGMKVALNYIDNLIPCHNLQSMELLINKLG